MVPCKWAYLKGKLISENIMIYNSGTPNNNESVEALIVMLIMALDSMKYPDVELSEATGPAAPVFFGISRLTTGVNRGKMYFRANVAFELDENILFDTPNGYAIADAAIPFSTTDEMPDKFSGTSYS